MTLIVGGTYTHPRKGSVVVLEYRPGFQLDVKLRGPDGDFWTSSADFVEERYRVGAHAELVAQLFRQGYSLYVMVRDDEQHARAEEEYKSWSGEDLPLEHVYLSKRPNISREWRLYFKLKPGMFLPFRLAPRGTGRLDGKGTEQGYLGPDNRVDVYWPTIIEQLVRAGLRTARLRP
jgi:hypothetical protein